MVASTEFHAAVEIAAGAAEAQAVVMDRLEMEAERLGLRRAARTCGARADAIRAEVGRVLAVLGDR